MTVKNIKMASMGFGHFNTHFAIIETENGKFYQYSIEYFSGQQSQADYFANAIHDFRNEFSNGYYVSDLFPEIKDDDELELWHEQWLIDAVRKV